MSIHAGALATNISQNLTVGAGNIQKQRNGGVWRVGGRGRAPWVADRWSAEVIDDIRTMADGGAERQASRL